MSEFFTANYLYLVKFLLCCLTNHYLAYYSGRIECERNIGPGIDMPLQVLFGLC